MNLQGSPSSMQKTSEADQETQHRKYETAALKASLAGDQEMRASQLKGTPSKVIPKDKISFINQTLNNFINSDVGSSSGGGGESKEKETVDSSAHKTPTPFLHKHSKLLNS
jgi:hypothetical protein